MVLVLVEIISNLYLLNNFYVNRKNFFKLQLRRLYKRGIFAALGGERTNDWVMVAHPFTMMYLCVKTRKTGVKDMIVARCHLYAAGQLPPPGRSFVFELSEGAFESHFRAPELLTVSGFVFVEISAHNQRQVWVDELSIVLAFRCPLVPRKGGRHRQCALKGLQCVGDGRPKVKVQNLDIALRGMQQDEVGRKPSDGRVDESDLGEGMLREESDPPAGGSLEDPTS